jgi:hypothetical protein
VSLSAALAVVGAGFETVGLAYAAIGFRRTWTAFRQLGDRFLTPITATLDRITSWMNRIFNHQPFRRTVSARGGLAVDLTVTARGRKMWSPLPRPEDDLGQFAAVVGERLSDLFDRVQALRFEILDEAKAASDRDSETRQLLDDYRAETQSTVQSITVGGLREQAFGWLLVVVGVVVQTTGQLV